MAASGRSLLRRVPLCGVVVDLYRRWGAAIANANANLRLTRLENLYTRGPTVRAWGARADADVDLGGFADLGDLAPPLPLA